MAIITSQLVQTKDLQQYFVDKDTGLPLSAGIVTLYKDSERTVLKNWYYQTGTPGNYTYTTLPNPMTLSAVGTTVDVNGADILPMYYPFSESDNTTQELYYITIYDSDGELQFTRSGFPFEPTGSTPTTETTVVRNYIVNNNFWRNYGLTGAPPTSTPQPINLSSQTQITLAPSQHDGFSMPDFQFIKNNTSATETATFLKFPLGTPVIDPAKDVQPEYYLNHECTAKGTGETLKVYQFPLSLHVQTLDSVDVTVTIETQEGSTSANNVITLFFYQFLGTGAPSQPAPTQIGNSITLGSAWEKSTFKLKTPSCLGLTLSSVGDDALYLQIGIPLDATCSVNFTLPSVYIGSVAPINDFNTYDQWDAIINSPRTGDYRQSMNYFAPFGWVPANDGSIGSAASGATTRANYDTWQLYSLLWNNVLNNWAPVATGRGVTAYADFTANKAMTLPRSLGRVLAGDNSVFMFTSLFTTAFGTNNNITLSTPTTVPLTVGTPVQITSTGAISSPLAINTVYYVTNGAGNVAPTTTVFALAATLDDAYTGYSAAIAITNDNGNTFQSITMALGAYQGASGTSQVPSHVHGISGGNFVTNGSGSSASVDNTGSAYFLESTTAPNTGSVTAISLLQPTVNVNVFLKL